MEFIVFKLTDIDLCGLVRIVLVIFEVIAVL